MEQVNIIIDGSQYCEICSEEMSEVSRLISIDREGYCNHSFCITCTNKIISMSSPKCPICQRALLGCAKDILANKLLKLIKDINSLLEKSQSKNTALEKEVEQLKQMISTCQDNIIQLQVAMQTNLDLIKTSQERERASEERERASEEREKVLAQLIKQLAPGPVLEYHRIGIEDWDLGRSNMAVIWQFLTDDEALQFWNRIKWYNTCVWMKCSQNQWALVREYIPVRPLSYCAVLFGQSYNHNELLLQKLKTLCKTTQQPRIWVQELDMR